MNIHCSYINNPENWDVIDDLVISNSNIVNFAPIKGLTDETIAKFNVDYRWYVSANRELSEDFIRENQDKVDWYYISQFQKLSENFIKEFENKLNWYMVSKYQNISKSFIKEFKHLISLEGLIHNPYHGYDLLDFWLNYDYR